MTCLGFSCPPALFGVGPSHSDFCKLPGEVFNWDTEPVLCFLKPEALTSNFIKSKTLSASVSNIIFFEKTD